MLKKKTVKNIKTAISFTSKNRLALNEILELMFLKLKGREFNIDAPKK